MKLKHIFCILFIIAIIIAIISSILYFYFLEELNPKDCLIISLSIVSLIIAAASACLNFIKFDNDNKNSIAKATFELIAKWDDEKLLRARKDTRTFRDKFEKDKKTYTLKKMQDDVYREIIDENGNHKDESLRESLILVFNFFELIKYSCDKKIVDKEAIKKHLGKIIDDFINERFTIYLEKEAYKSNKALLDEMKNFAKEIKPS
ncbi:hypothetical protein [Campylobacter lanienae]|uniref:DUF4760 domain-containing protein n=1 Tax=Campylobacter lanienae TaxID=75658 RepID=UPI002A90BFA6|nr:hypothetical protein [Campylobacter lanienae]MDY6134568.1 hypothetical protein [Campylobacter lanienae]